jgi:GT2 family glycosyltransferase
LTAAVVILNYNGVHFLKQFLPGVVQHSGKAKIYVADNGSTDDSVEYVRTNFPRVVIIQNFSNGGFAKGYNDALKHVEEDIYILLNSDIEVGAGWTEPCIQLLESNPQISAVQPKILSWKKKNNFEHAGAAGGFLDANYYPFCQGRIVDVVEADEGQYNQSREVFWATGACLFIRKAVYREHGGFDEDFFAHMEEIDLCWRIKLRGGKIWYCADASVWHVGGGTLSYENPKKTYLNFRNCLYMILKNHHGPVFWKLVKRMYIDGIAAAVFLFKFEFRNFAAVFKAHMKFYGMLSENRAKRKLIQAKVHNPNMIGIYKGSIVFQRFLSGMKSFAKLDQSRFT